MKLSISLPDELVARIDAERGLVTRSAWIGAQLLAVLRPVDFGTPALEAERSPEPRVEPKPPREAKAERLEKARAVMDRPIGEMVRQPRPIVQKKQK